MNWNCRWFVVRGVLSFSYGKTKPSLNSLLMCIQFSKHSFCNDSKIFFNSTRSVYTYKYYASSLRLKFLRRWRCWYVLTRPKLANTVAVYPFFTCGNKCLFRWRSVEHWSLCMWNVIWRQFISISTNFVQHPMLMARTMAAMPIFEDMCDKCKATWIHISGNYAELYNY